VGEYKETVPDYGDLMTVKDFMDSCVIGAFIDYDGYGHPVKDGKMMGSVAVLPSKRREIPEDATHIVWFNR
jgi:hypothetical protein